MKITNEKLQILGFKYEKESNRWILQSHVCDGVYCYLIRDDNDNGQWLYCCDLDDGESCIPTPLNIFELTCLIYLLLRMEIKYNE